MMAKTEGEAWIMRGNSAADSIASRIPQAHPEVFAVWQQLQHDFSTTAVLRQAVHSTIVAVGMQAVQQRPAKQVVNETKTKPRVQADQIVCLNLQFPEVTEVPLRYRVSGLENFLAWLRRAEHEATSQAQALRNVVGEEAKARRRSIANNMLLAYGRGAELQKQNRADREVEMIQRLQSLIQESELVALKKELTLAAQGIATSPTLLVGGAAQLAQRILVPRFRAAVPRHEQDEQAALKEALSQMRKAGRSGADLAAHAEVRRIAKEIVHLSAKNATQCYHHAGFDDEDRKNQVAAALRLLEHELFGAEEEQGGGGFSHDLGLDLHRHLKISQWISC
eukprot:symbB.v1.2.007006.t1/scaffold385.1/size305797/2